MNTVVIFNAVQPVCLALHLGCRQNAPLPVSPRLGRLQLSRAMQLLVVSLFLAAETCVTSRQRTSRVCFPSGMVTENVEKVTALSARIPEQLK